jgi:hypothetical protein
MLRGGFGFWRLVTEFTSDNSWDQEIKLKWIRNPFTVHMDCFANEPDYSDAEWGFIWDDIPHAKYKRDYPDSQLASITEFGKLGDTPADWINKDTIRVAEYFHVEFEEHSLDLLSDGSTALDGQILPGSDATVVKSRTVHKRTVVWTKINAVEKLDETDWAGKWIPIIPVNGIDIIVNGKRYLAGLVRNAKDSQRMYNYHCSAATEAVALAPKAPWVAVAGSIAGFENLYEQSNRRNIAVLPYNSVDVGGKPAPPPTRSTVEPPIQAMMLMLRQAGEDFQQATGIFPPALGNAPKDQSGKAIALLQRRSDVGNVNWTDNLSRSVRFSTRQILDLAPHVYDAPRLQRIINPDGSAEQVGVFNSQKHPDGKAQLEAQGIKKVFDLGKGNYDVVVTVGPSYQTKRQEAVASIMALVAAYPPIMQAAGDILVRNMDWAESQQIADRLKKMLPAQLQESEDGEPTPEQLQAQLAQTSQQNQALTQALQQANQIIETKGVEAKNKLDVEGLRSQTDVINSLIDERVKIAVAEINASKDRDNAEGEKLLRTMEMAHDAAHEVAMRETAPPEVLPVDPNNPQGAQPAASPNTGGTP